MPDETQEREAVDWRVALWDAINRRFPEDARPARPGRMDFVVAVERPILAHIDNLTRARNEARQDAATARDVLVDVIRQRDYAQETVRLFGLTYGEPGTVRDLAEANARLARFEALAREADMNRQMAGPGTEEHAVDILARLAALAGPEGA